MNRFILAPEAQDDLNRIKEYLDTLPAAPALRIATSLQKALDGVAQQPFLGIRQAELSRRVGSEIRSCLCENYRVFYRPGVKTPEILAILHTAQDLASILRARIQ